MPRSAIGSRQGYAWWLQRMDQAQINEICGPFVNEMAESLSRKDSNSRWHITGLDGFIAVPSSLDASRAKLVVPVLAAALDRETDAYDRTRLASALAMAAQMEPKDASRYLRRAAGVIVAELEKQTFAPERGRVFGILVSVAQRYIREGSPAAGCPPRAGGG